CYQHCIFSSYSLSSYRNGSHRHPHSFPTRPLPISVLDAVVQVHGGDLAGHDVAHRRFSRGTPLQHDLARVVTLGKDADQLAGLRSEEHTSELQSREKLVCRLLLEKKKAKSGRIDVI